MNSNVKLMQYKEPVRAVQYTGDNVFEILDFITSEFRTGIRKVEVDLEWEKTVISLTDENPNIARTIELYTGDWLSNINDLCIRIANKAVAEVFSVTEPIIAAGKEEVDVMDEVMPCTGESTPMYTLRTKSAVAGVEYTGSNAEDVLYFAGGDESTLLCLDPDDNSRLCRYTPTGDLEAVEPGSWIMHFEDTENVNGFIVQSAAETARHWEVEKRVGGIGRVTECKGSGDVC